MSHSVDAEAWHALEHFDPEFATRDVELIEEETCPSKKCLQKSKRLAEKQERRERLNACVTEADSDANDY
jgi:hypothetical protein